MRPRNIRDQATFYYYFSHARGRERRIQPLSHEFAKSQGVYLFASERVVQYSTQDVVLGTKKNRLIKHPTLEAPSASEGLTYVVIRLICSSNSPRLTLIL